MALYLLLGETIEREAREHRALTLTVGGSRASAATPACDASVLIRLRELSSGPVLAPGHR